MKTTNENRLNYFYNGTPISKKNFLNSVPENWKDEINENGEYSFGYYRASTIEE